jgi:hypothetical protein
MALIQAQVRRCFPSGQNCAQSSTKTEVGIEQQISAHRTVTDSDGPDSRFIVTFVAGLTHRQVTFHKTQHL